MKNFKKIVSIATMSAVLLALPGVSGMIGWAVEAAPVYGYVYRTETPQRALRSLFGNKVDEVVYDVDVVDDTVYDSGVSEEVIDVVEKAEKYTAEKEAVTLKDVAPIDKDDKIMMPVRFVAESLGAEVAWDGATQTVIMKDENVEVKITVDSNVAVVNGVEEALGTPAYLEDDRTYAPVYYIAEKFGASVAWDDIFKVYRIIKK